MNINHETQLFLSLSSQPGRFGTYVYNRIFRETSQNCIYKAVKVDNLKDALMGVKALGVGGCSIAMPFKELVIPFLDTLDNSASRVGAVNTVLNRDANLIGFNTDFLGFSLLLRELNLSRSSRVLLLGSGGAAKAVLAALMDCQFERVMVAYRNHSSLNSLRSIFPAATVVSWDDREGQEADLIINATPVGMGRDRESIPISESYVQSSKVIFEFINSPIETGLVKLGRQLNKKVITGDQISLKQILFQYEIYTGRPAPKNLVSKIVSSILS